MVVWMQLETVRADVQLAGDTVVPYADYRVAAALIAAFALMYH